MDTEVRMTIRVPKSAADFLDREAKENYTSRNAEIVRSIRERMKKAAGDNPGRNNPAAEANTSAGNAG